MATHLNLHLPFFLCWLFKDVWFCNGNTASLTQIAFLPLAGVWLSTTVSSFFMCYVRTSLAEVHMQVYVGSVEDRVQQGRSALHASSH